MKGNVINIHENLSPKIKKTLGSYYSSGIENQAIKYQNQSTSKSYNGIVFSY
jgi:hypothetical protein